jgi:uncharacterized lipoprotein YajG
MKGYRPAVLCAAALVLGATLLTGCSIAVTPNFVPPLKASERGSLSGVTIGVLNAEKDSAPYQILNAQGESLGLVADRRAWSKELTEAVAVELARRGAIVQARAQLSLSVSLPEIRANRTGSVYRFRLTAVVSSSTGWTKAYDAAAETRSGIFEPVNAVADRLAGLTLAEAVKAIMGDAEFALILQAPK